MRLRLLQEDDASKMHEWMLDNEVTEFLKKDFSCFSIDDCIEFIKVSHDSKDCLHYAIVNDLNEYMGTISLKNIHDHIAELGVVVRKCAMGKGYSSFGLKEVFNIARDRDIHEIIWCVNPHNIRAIRFYNKHGFSQCKIRQAIGYTKKEMSEYVWYCAYTDKAFL